MLTVAIESSAPRSSLALTRDGELLEETSYQPLPRKHEQIFEVLQSILGDAGLECEAIERYVYGRGPGNYTGIRIALTMVQALALPGDREVVGVSSGAALAKSVLCEESVERVAVVGDARRDRFWVGIFVEKDQALQIERQWSLCDRNQLREIIPSGSTIVSSEMERLRERLPCDEWDDLRWISENRYPAARLLAEIASNRIQRGEEMEPLDPLYMHPAV